MKIYKNGELTENRTIVECEDSYDIFCMAKIGHSTKPAFCVCVNPDAGRVGDPYLKYYNAQNCSKAKSVIRLGLKEPKLIHHKDGKLDWDVNKKELKQLDTFLSSNSKTYRGYTNWQVTIYHWNYEYGLLDEDYPEEYNSLIDAYFNGYYDTPDNISEPSYIPSYQKQIFYSDSI